MENDTEHGQSSHGVWCILMICPQIFSFKKRKETQVKIRSILANRYKVVARCSVYTVHTNPAFLKGEVLIAQPLRGVCMMMRGLWLWLCIGRKIMRV